MYAQAQDKKTIGSYLHLYKQINHLKSIKPGEFMNQSPLHNYMAELHQKYADMASGTVADYIPELTKADPDWFGIVLVTVDGHIYAVGDTDIPFTLQSISKPFTYGIALEDKGPERIRNKINVEPSGEAFNRISLEHGTGRPRNAMINAGAIATVSQINGDSSREIFSRILEKFSMFAGKNLEIDNDVYLSEKNTGHRNRAIAHMLLNSGVIDGDPEEILDVYFKQCSITVTCKDIAVMAATLANQGKNPVTGVQAVNKNYVHNILSIMSSCGMYDSSGAWTYDIGLPAKSGVGGGIVAVLPGKSALAVFSPRLDSFGNSVRGIKVCERFSQDLGLHIFKSDRLTPVSIIRASYTIDEIPSKRKRTRNIIAHLEKEGKRVRVYELTGEMGFSATEVVLSRIEQDFNNHEVFILGLNRVTAIDKAATNLLARFVQILNAANKQLVLSDIQTHVSLMADLDNILSELGSSNSLQVFDDIDLATEWCENYLLEKSEISGEVIRTAYLSQQELLLGLTSDELDYLRTFGEEKNYAQGNYLCRVGDNSSDLYFIQSGYVSVMLPLGGRRQQRLATFDAGSAFGEFSVVDKLPRSANIIANTDVKCLLVNYDKLEQDTSETAKNIRFSIISNLTQILVSDLRRANKEIRALGV